MFLKGWHRKLNFRFTLIQSMIESNTIIRMYFNTYFIVCLFVLSIYFFPWSCTLYSSTKTKCVTNRIMWKIRKNPMWWGHAKVFESVNLLFNVHKSWGSFLENSFALMMLNSDRRHKILSYMYRWKYQFNLTLHTTSFSFSLMSYSYALFTPKLNLCGIS